jgi:hypothetical protein
VLPFSEATLVLRELSLAEQLGKKVIPVLICNAPLGKYASTFMWINMRSVVPHECDDSCINSAGCDSPPPSTITLNELAISLGLSSADLEQVDMAWEKLVKRNRLGMIIRTDESKALLAASAAVSVAIIAAAHTPPFFTLAIGVGVGVVVATELGLNIVRWYNFAVLKEMDLPQTPVQKY